MSKILDAWLEEIRGTICHEEGLREILDQLEKDLKDSHPCDMVTIPAGDMLTIVRSVKCLIH